MRTSYLLLVLFFSGFMSGCSGCSRSGRLVKADSGSPADQRNRANKPDDVARRRASSRRITVVPIDRRNGVDHIDVEVNGFKLPFVFDTGASSICISSLEANAMYKAGVLSEDDLREIVQMQDATGRITQAQRIILRNVRIMDRVLQDVEALIMQDPEAPLLLGRSALDRFGSISIDNKKGVILFD
jgi:clan AA aspartic protease (TIGR02281 family)